MNDEARKKADEVFQAKLRELEGKSGQKSELAHMQAQSLAGIDLSAGSICQQGPKILDMVEKQLGLFGWLIPDNIEKPAKALLAALKSVVLPAFCGTASGSGAAAASATAAGTGSAVGGAQKRS